MNACLSLRLGALGLLITSSAHAETPEAALAAMAPPSLRLAAQVEALPLGTAKATSGGASASSDAELAYGVSASVEYALHPLISVGIAPRLVLHVQSKAATDDAQQELDLRAVVRAHYPLGPALEVYAAVTPGWSFVLGGPDGMDTPNGFAIGGALGASLAVSRRAFVAGELGYQRAFTRAGGADLDLSYPHAGVGAGLRF